MNAREVMTSAVISATADTPVWDIAQLLLQNHISAVPILDKSGAPIGMVSEGDLVGRDETERDARREWWLALLAEGELLGPDFLSSLRHPERIASDVMSRPVITIGEDTDTARSRVCLLHIGSSACPWCETGRWSESSAARICCARLQGKNVVTTSSLTRELWRALWGTCWRRSSGVSSVRTMRPNPMPRQ